MYFFHLVSIFSCLGSDVQTVIVQEVMRFADHGITRPRQSTQLLSISVICFRLKKDIVVICLLQGKTADFVGGVLFFAGNLLWKKAADFVGAYFAREICCRRKQLILLLLFYFSREICRGRTQLILWWRIFSREISNMVCSLPPPPPTPPRARSVSKPVSCFRWTCITRGEGDVG